MELFEHEKYASDIKFSFSQLFTSIDRIYCLTNHKTIFCWWQIASFVIKFNLPISNRKESSMETSFICFRSSSGFVKNQYNYRGLLTPSKHFINLSLNLVDFTSGLFSRLFLHSVCWVILSDSAMIENCPIKKIFPPHPQTNFIHPSI